MVFDVLFLIFCVLATAGVVVTIADFANLGILVREPGLGRVLFGTVISLKFWVFLVLVDFFIAIIYPPVIIANRQVIRFLLAVYLVMQTTGTLIALERWKRKKDTTL